MKSVQETTTGFSLHSPRGIEVAQPRESRNPAGILAHESWLKLGSMSVLRKALACMLIIAAAMSATVGGLEDEETGGMACSLIFVSPRQDQRVRQDAKTFPMAILLRGSQCEERGKISVALDGGLQVELEISQGKAVGDIIAIIQGEHGSDGATHTLTASAAGALHSSIQFSFGPPRPAVAIMEPRTGSETSDEPIEVFLTFTDFEIPSDGHAVVTVDGTHFDTVSSPHTNFVALHRMPAGQHTVRVSLHDQTNERELASHETAFTVVRPSITLLSAYVAQDEKAETKQTGTRVNVRVSVQHLHPHGEFLLLVFVVGTGAVDGLEPVLLPGQHVVSRSDVYHFSIDATGAGARAGDGIRVTLSEKSEDICTPDDKGECATENGAAWQRVGSSDLQLLAAPALSQQQKSRACPHVFISAGAHNGGDMFDLLAVGSSSDSDKWQSHHPSDRAWAWWKNLTINVATDVQSRDFCMIAIEANPHMTTILEDAAAVVRKSCRGVEVMGGAAAWVEDGSIDLILDTRQEKTGMSSSVLERHPEAKGARVTVKSISTQRLVRSARERAGEGGVVVLKMDIEGAEYEVLRAMTADGSLCSSVDYLWVEWHAMAVQGGSDAPPGDFERVLEWIAGAKGCRTRVFGSLY